MKFLVLVAGLVVVAANVDDKAKKVDAKEKDVDAKVDKKEEKIDAKVDKKEEKVTGEMKVKVKKDVRRLEGRRLSFFTKKPETDTSMKQTIAQAANTTADKVQTTMVDSADTSDTDAGQKRLLTDADGSSVVTTSYTVSVANGAEAAKVHSALKAAAPADMDAIFQKQLVANNVTGYTATVTGHTVSDNVVPKTQKDCKDVSESSTDAAEAKCYKNAMWAKITGSQGADTKQWYVNYSTVTNESSVAAWQCVLYQKSVNPLLTGGEESHNCSKACNFNVDCVAVPAPTPAPAAVVKDVATKKSDGGMPVWGWVLIVLGVCCVGGAVAAYVLGVFEGKAPKKKRAIKKVVEPPAAAPAAPVAMFSPVITTSVPMPVYTMAPQVTYAAPQVIHAQPQVTYAAPQVTYEPQVTYAAPTAHYGAPSYTMQAQPVYQEAFPASVTYAAPSAVAYNGEVTMMA